MTEPGDFSGGDFTGGDDGQIQLIAPSITTPVQNINGNTYNGGFNFTFQLNANAGSPDTNKTWSLNGIGTLTQSGFYTFPSLSQGQTSSGSLVITVSNNNGSNSQTWNYNIINTSPPYFTSSNPVSLSANSTSLAVVASYVFTANRGAPNTGSTLNWSISPNSYVASFTGDNDTTRTLQLSFPQNTDADGTYTVSINNANGSASQAWSFNIFVDTTTDPPPPTAGNYWALQSDNSIKNTNAQSVLVNKDLQADWVKSRVSLISQELGFITSITDEAGFAGGGGGGIGVPTAFIQTFDNKYILFNKIIDSDGKIHFNFLKNVPNFASTSSSTAATALGALGTALGLFAVADGFVGGALTNCVKSLFGGGTSNAAPSTTYDANGEPERSAGNEFDYDYEKLSKRPFVGLPSKFGAPQDVYWSDNKAMFVLPASNFFVTNAPRQNINCTTGNPYKIIDFATKYHYGVRFIAGDWSLRNDGLYYKNQRMLGGNNEAGSSSSTNLTDVADGVIRGLRTNLAGIGRKLGAGRKGASVYSVN